MLKCCFQGHLQKNFSWFEIQILTVTSYYKKNWKIDIKPWRGEKLIYQFVINTNRPHNNLRTNVIANFFGNC